MTQPRAVSAPGGTLSPIDRSLLSVLIPALASITIAAIAVASVALWKDRSAHSLVWSAVWLGLMVWAARDDGRWPVLAVIGFAVLLRWQGFVLLDGVSLRGDPMNYANLAAAILDGRGIVVDDWRYGDELRTHWPPLYGIVLALWWALAGQSALSTLILQAALAAATALMLFSCARAMGAARAGRFCALAFIAYPAFALTVYPNKEVLLILIVAVMLRLALAWLAGPRIWHGWALGALWGLLALGQPSWALIPALIALLLWRKRGLAALMRLAMPAIAALVLVMLPWWARNWMIYGEFIPLTTAGGYSFWVALGDRSPPFPADLHDLPEPQRGDVMSALSLQTIAAALPDYVRGVLVNAAKVFAYEEAMIGVLRNAQPALEAAPRAGLTFFAQFTWVALLAAAAVGTLRQWQSGQADFAAQCALLIIVSLVGVNMWLEFGERHRQILTPFLMLIAARGFARKLPPGVIPG